MSVSLKQTAQALGKPPGSKISLTEILLEVNGGPLPPGTKGKLKTANQAVIAKNLTLGSVSAVAGLNYITISWTASASAIKHSYVAITCIGPNGINGATRVSPQIPQNQSTYTFSNLTPGSYVLRVMPLDANTNPGTMSSANYIVKPVMGTLSTSYDITSNLVIASWSNTGRFAYVIPSWSGAATGQVTSNPPTAPASNCVIALNANTSGNLTLNTTPYAADDSPGNMLTSTVAIPITMGDITVTSNDVNSITTSWSGVKYNYVNVDITGPTTSNARITYPASNYVINTTQVLAHTLYLTPYGTDGSAGTTSTKLGGIRASISDITLTTSANSNNIDASWTGNYTGMNLLWSGTSNGSAIGLSGASYTITGIPPGTYNVLAIPINSATIPGPSLSNSIMLKPYVRSLNMTYNAASSNVTATWTNMGRHSTVIPSWTGALSGSGTAINYTTSNFVLGLNANTSGTLGFSITPYATDNTVGNGLTSNVNIPIDIGVVTSSSNTSSITWSWTGKKYGYVNLSWTGPSTSNALIYYPSSNYTLSTTNSNVYTFTFAPYGTDSNVGSNIVQTASITAAAVNNYIPGAQFNLQAKDLSGVVADAGKVSSWGIFTQSTATAQPTFRASGGYLSRPYVQFNGTSTGLITSSISYLPASGGGLTIGMVVKFKTPGSGWERLLSGVSTSTLTDDMAINRYDVTNNITFHTGGVDYQYTTDGSGIVNDQWAVYTYRYTQSNKTLTIKRNNTTIVQKTDATFNIRDYAAINFGFGCHIWNTTRTPMGFYGNIDVNAFLLYTRAFSDAEMTSLYNYLAT